jgi:hypothetical protein
MDHPESGIRIEFGDQEILVPQLVFYTIELAWPAIERLKSSQGIVQETGSCIDIVVAALALAESEHPQLYADIMKRMGMQDWNELRTKLATRLRGEQMADMVIKTLDLMRVSGLLPKRGEGQAPPAEAVPGAATSMETAPPSSPSSSATA